MVKENNKKKEVYGEREDKKIVITPITRIEGHAQVTIFLDNNDNVENARFQVVDFRGFEKFSQGRPFYEMPLITSRSCGICPVSHILASAKACDAIVGVKPPETTVMLRRLMHMGQMIQSHALNFFHLSAPDILLGMDSNQEERNIFGLIEKKPNIAIQGVKLRKFGQEIIEKVAGKRIHSADWIVPGGAKWSLKKENVDYLLSNLPEALDITLSTLEIFKKLLIEFEDVEVENFGDCPSRYMALVTKDGGLEHYDGYLRIVDQSGKILADQIDPAKYYEYIGEAVEPWSYMKFPYLKSLGYPEGDYRVGPLARLNVASYCGTPLADEELKQFRKHASDGCVHSAFHYHYARLIETLFCIETAKRLLEASEITSEWVASKGSVNSFEGVGVAEAPRGTLIHHYTVDPYGIVTWVNMIIATEHNNSAYNKAVTQVAKKYVKPKKLEEGMLNRVEAVIRAFDPCLSCATHAVGSMPLKVSLVDANGRLVDQIVRF